MPIPPGKPFPPVLTMPAPGIFASTLGEVKWLGGGVLHMKKLIAVTWKHLKVCVQTKNPRQLCEKIGIIHEYYCPKGCSVNSKRDSCYTRTIRSRWIMEESIAFLHWPHFGPSYRRQTEAPSLVVLGERPCPPAHPGALVLWWATLGLWANISSYHHIIMPSWLKRAKLCKIHLVILLRFLSNITGCRIHHSQLDDFPAPGHREFPAMDYKRIAPIWSHYVVIIVNQSSLLPAHY